MKGKGPLFQPASRFALSASADGFPVTEAIFSKYRCVLLTQLGSLSISLPFSPDPSAGQTLLVRGEARALFVFTAHPVLSLISSSISL